jgi:hypothetical protein
MKKVVLILILLLGPAVLAITTSSCNEEVNYFELIDQETSNAFGGSFSQAHVQITYEMRKYQANSESSTFFTPLYATSPSPPRLRFKIASIEITADKSFGVNYPAGSDLNDFFEVMDWHNTPVTYPVKYLEGSVLFARMKKAPEANVETTLTVTTTFEHGPSLTSTTPQMTITK